MTNEQLNEENFFENISNMSSNKLCEVIVAFRYLKTMQDEAQASMEELIKRREAGDDFPFESHIDKLLASLPKFKLDLSQIQKMTRMF